MRRLALVPFFMVGLLAGVWLVVSPWVVGFPPGAHGGWSASRWSEVLAGAIVVGVSAVVLVTTVGLALAAVAPGADEAPPE